MDLVKVSLLMFYMVVLMETLPANARAGKPKLRGDLLSSREEVVTWAGYGEETLSKVVITGKLFCRSSHYKHNSRHPSYPVSGASVAVFCGSSSGKARKSWVKGSTGSSGEFLMDLPSHLHAIPNLEKICLVKVLHLPKSCPCRHAFTGKHKAIKLTSIAEGLRIYTTRNIHLMPKPSQEYARDGAMAKHTISVL